jgi:proton glutamate symport protein
MTDLLFKRLPPLLLHPLTVMAGLVLGGVYGWFDRGQTPMIDLAGDLYLRMLQMCVIPLVFTAVVTSLGKLFVSGTASRYLARLVLIVVVGLLIASGLGILIGLWGAPGAEIHQDARQVIGNAVFSAEAMATPAGGDGSQTFVDIALGIVPENIFVALSTGNMLAILFFAIMFGVALGSIEAEKSERAIATFESFYETFITIIGWMMYALPIGLFCLAYGQFASIGLPVLVALAKLVAYIYVGCIILVALSMIVIWMCVGGSFWASLRSQREALFIAFGTASGLATLPAAMRGLKDGLKIDRKVVDLVMPLGITLNPPGSVFHFSIATVFLANLYGVNLDAGQIAFVLIASCLAGMAATGAPGIAALSCMSLILVPLGLPVEVAIILLAAVDPIIDPAVTVVSVQANSASAAILGRSAQDEELGADLDAVPAE